jgi:hypothetical protein
LSKEPAGRGAVWSGGGWVLDGARFADEPADGVVEAAGEAEVAGSLGWAAAVGGSAFDAILVESSGAGLEGDGTDAAVVAGFVDELSSVMASTPHPISAAPARK